MHYTIPQLAEIDAEFPHERKLLLVPSVNYGRELLASLAMQRGGWIGWEVATLGTIAAKLSVVELARRKRRRATDVAVAAAINVAFERAIARNEASADLASLAWSAGTRRAVFDAILELRVSGVSAAELRSLGTYGMAPSLAAIMEHYGEVVAELALADAAELFSAALAAFDEEAPFVLDHRVLVAVPNWSTHGMPAQLMEKLAKRGLRVLAPPDVVASGGLPELVTEVAGRLPDGRIPPRALFCAGSPTDEVRSVLRQVIAQGRRLDEVEISTTDRDTYGASLDAVSDQLGISYTSLDGVPFSRTRIGRSVERWLRWIESSFQSDILREALESGDFTAGPNIDSAALGRELRALKIGWGLDATRLAITTLRSANRLGRVRAAEGEDEAAYAKRVEHRTVAMDDLAAFLESLTSLAPAAGALIPMAALARRTVGVMAFVVPRGAAETATRQRFLERLAQIADVEAEPVELMYAIASLRQELSDLRAWTDNSRTSKPRRAAGGHVHLTSIENASTTGRPLRFIVGLDAERTAGTVAQSALLPDALRARLNERGADLPTTEHRRRERALQLQTAIASPAEHLTLSYSAKAAGEEREVGPAPVMLDTARQWTGHASLSYRDLYDALGQVRSPIPSRSAGEAPVNARDVWLEAINDGALMLDATETLRRSLPMLDRGLAAEDARAHTEAGAFHGMVPGAGLLDPRVHGNPISPSSLERIAACGLRWFYTVALDARIPNEPVYDALVWLNALDRGLLLHRVYELLIGERLHTEPASAARSGKIARIVQRVAREFQSRIPPPSDSVLAREMAALLDDAALFVATEHEAYVKEPWETVALESQFGGSDVPASLPLDDGTVLQLHGRVDRVDRLADGTLRLIDYKTGRAFEFEEKRGSFNGGRKLQLALYSPAISAQYGAVVSRAEYRFTTAKGDGAVATANEALMAEAPRLVRSLLDDVAAGRFLPTIDIDDCRFCDYMAVCRVTQERFKFDSPRAAWAKLHATHDSAYANAVARRTPRGDAE